jgi:hypothetical protein
MKADEGQRMKANESRRKPTKANESQNMKANESK